jgi:hypothetical protein
MSRLPLIYHTFFHRYLSHKPACFHRMDPIFFIATDNFVSGPRVAVGVLGLRLGVRGGAVVRRGVCSTPTP